MYVVKRKSFLMPTATVCCRYVLKKTIFLILYAAIYIMYVVKRKSFLMPTATVCCRYVLKKGIFLILYAANIYYVCSKERVISDAYCNSMLQVCSQERDISDTICCKYVIMYEA